MPRAPTPPGVIQRVLHAHVSRLLDQLIVLAPGVVDVLGPTPDIQRAVNDVQRALGLHLLFDHPAGEDVEGADDPPPSYNEAVAHSVAARHRVAQVPRRRVEHAPALAPARAPAPAPAARLSSRRRGAHDQEDEEQDAERTRLVPPAPVSAPAPAARLSSRRRAVDQEDDGEQADDEGTRIASRPRLANTTNIINNVNTTSNSNTNERTRIVTPRLATNTTNTTAAAAVPNIRPIAPLPRRDGSYHAGSGCCPPDHTGPCLARAPPSIFATVVFPGATLTSPTTTTTTTTTTQGTSTKRATDDEPEDENEAKRARQAPRPMFRVGSSAPYVPPPPTESGERGPRRIAGEPGSARRLRELAAGEPEHLPTPAPAPAARVLPEFQPALPHHTTHNALGASAGPAFAAYARGPSAFATSKAAPPPRATHNALDVRSTTDGSAFAAYARGPSAFAMPKNFNMLTFFARAGPYARPVDAVVNFAACNDALSESVPRDAAAGLEAGDMGPRRRTNAVVRTRYNPYRRP